MKRVGVSELRKMNAAYLRKLDEPLEICSGVKPLRVIIPYSQYMELQSEYLSLVDKVRNLEGSLE
jgi:hypothetical protein